MVAWGEQTIPSGIAALLIATMPLWVAILGGLFLGERLPRLAVAGIVVGFAGIAILVGPSALGGVGAMDPAGLVALLISPLAWALGSLFASHRASPAAAGRSSSTGAQMLTGGAGARGHGLGQRRVGRRSSRRRSRRTRSLAFVYLTVDRQPRSRSPRTAGCCASRRCPLISTYAYVNPVVAVILGALDPPGADRCRGPSSPAPSSSSPSRSSSRSRTVRAPAADRQPQPRRPPRSRRRQRLGQDRPRHPSGERHDRDHRVDADAGREQGPVADVEAADDRVASRSDADAPATDRTDGSSDRRPSGPSPSGGPRTRPRGSG